MKLHFHKLDGAGNDFVALDWRGRDALAPDVLSALALALCHRNHGVGADGLLLLGDSRSGADFSMKYVNADGSVGEMCGNGARCITVFAHFLGAAGKTMSFDTDAGPYKARITDGGARVEFPDVQALPEMRHLQAPPQSGRAVQFLQVGVPHAVLFVEDLDLLEVGQLGREIRHDPVFKPAGTNANFAEEKNQTIHLRTYERGVEAETLACGTGAVATACCFLHQYGIKEASRLQIIPTGGQALTIHATPTADGFTSIALEGPAKIVFEGHANFGIDAGLAYQK